MEKLIEAFGIDGRLIIIQIVNFAILAVALSYFLYNPILNMLKSREEKIKQGVEDAEAAAAAKASADTEKAEVLSAANKEAEDMVARAKTLADEKGAEIVKSAEDKAENTIQDARLKGVEIQNQARKESEAEIAKLAVLAAEKVLREKAS